MNPFAHKGFVEVDGVLSRVPSKPQGIAGDSAATVESELHDQIMAACEAQGWLYFHGAMSRRTHRTLGEPDFIILMPGGKTLLVECKTKTGKVSMEQQAVIAHAAKLGHVVHVIRSVGEFNNLIRGN